MNKHFVTPKVYLIGYTGIDYTAILQYLEDTNQQEFISDMNVARDCGISPGEILCSFYAKACYSALTTKKNLNISKVRDIEDNLEGVIASGHGSVLEHASMNFMITNCSRILTHELVRHRVGTAFSQTSGRYVRNDVLNVVVDPILEQAYDLVEEARVFLEDWYKRLEDKMDITLVSDFDRKKKITSAMRRMLPNGQANEIGISLNFRSLRHLISMRTSRHAEWEIRVAFNQVYDLVKEKFPVMFLDATEEMVEGYKEIIFKYPKI